MHYYWDGVANKNLTATDPSQLQDTLLSGVDAELGVVLEAPWPQRLLLQAVHAAGAAPCQDLATCFAIGMLEVMVVKPNVYVTLPERCALVLMLLGESKARGAARTLAAEMLLDARHELDQNALLDGPEQTSNRACLVKHVRDLTVPVLGAP